MDKVRYEVWRDSECRRLWGLELLDHEIIGCVGPFRDDAAFPPRLPDFADIAFERNADLLRWISRKRLPAHPTGPTAEFPPPPPLSPG